jgi:hypothetical protein
MKHCSISECEDLIKEWDFNKNINLSTALTKGSNKKAWWKCENGHEWESVISKRALRKDGCPYCYKYYCKEGNSLQEKMPELKKQWSNKNKVDFEKVAFSSGRKHLWKCDYGHEWEASPRKINRYKKNDCPYCPLENSLIDKHDFISNIWNYNKNKKTPDFYTPNSGQKVWWKCEKGHEWEAVISNIVKGIGCPYCSGRNASLDNNIFIDFPNLKKEWNFELNPDYKTIKSGSGKKVWWKCEKGHEWKASPHKRTMGRRCPICNKIELLDGTICDSKIDAFFYLKFVEKNIEFLYNNLYKLNNKKIRFDFYLPKENKYIEVTSFTKHENYNSVQYFKYIKNIAYKKRLVNKNGSNFEFIQKKLNAKEENFVAKNIKRSL